MSTQTMILAVRSHNLPKETLRTSFIALPEHEIMTMLNSAGLWIGPRSQLEDLPDFRQIIPYVVIKQGDKFLTYSRTTAGGESRLHGKASIGVGGHIDISDVEFLANSVDLQSTLARAADREVAEELQGVERLKSSWIGLIVDNDNAVGRVHIGVVAIWEVSTIAFSSAEDAIGNIETKELIELSNYQDRLETWSSLLIEHLK